MRRKSQCDEQFNCRERGQTIFSLDKIQERFEQGGSGHGHQVLLSKDSNTNHNLKHTELDLTAATHQLQQLLGNKGPPEGREPSRSLT